MNTKNNHIAYVELTMAIKSDTKNLSDNIFTFIVKIDTDVNEPISELVNKAIDKVCDTHPGLTCNNCKIIDYRYLGGDVEFVLE